MLALRQLQQFIVVAEELNFRRAAQRLHMSQPPLTQAIRRLEAAVRAELFERNRNTVRLTAAGAVLLEEAQRIVALTKAAIDATQRAAGGTRGRLRLAFVPSAALGIVPSVVRAFQRLHPEVGLELSSETTTMQIDSLRSNRIDAGILVPPLRDAPDISVTNLRREHLVAVVPVDHPLGRTARIELQQLADEPFILFPLAQGPAFLSAILTACLGAGFFPRVTHEAPQLQTVVALVACGLGVSLVPEVMRTIRHYAVHYLEIASEPTPAYDLAVACLQSSRNPVIARFVGIARDTAARWSGLEQC
ncbi:MAG TPA: LysR family transcriptional regulator [Gemmatimonadaceae bacterium]|nr:LysR family transcriptional regulator [Gemmatimonadaceae bacterium]